MVFLVRKKIALLSSLCSQRFIMIYHIITKYRGDKPKIVCAFPLLCVKYLRCQFVLKSAKRHGCRCRTIRHWSHHTSLLFRRFHPSAIAWRMRNMSGIHSPLSLLISCHIHPPHRVDHIIIKSRVWRSSWGALVIRLQWRIRRQMPWLPKCPNWRGSSIS